MDVGLVSRSSVTPRPLRSALRLASEVYAVFRRSKLPSFLLLLLLLLLFFSSFSRSRRATRSSNPSTTVEKGTAVLWNLSRCSMAEDLDEVPREVAVVLWSSHEFRASVNAVGHRVPRCYSAGQSARWKREGESRGVLSLSILSGGTDGEVAWSVDSISLSLSTFKEELCREYFWAEDNPNRMPANCWESVTKRKPWNTKLKKNLDSWLKTRRNAKLCPSRWTLLETSSNRNWRSNTRKGRTNFHSENYKIYKLRGAEESLIRAILNKISSIARVNRRTRESGEDYKTRMVISCVRGSGFLRRDPQDG